LLVLQSSSLDGVSLDPFCPNFDNRLHPSTIACNNAIAQSSAPVRTRAMPRRTKLGGPLSIRLEPEVRAAVEELAKADERSLSAYINRVLRQHVETVSKKPKGKG
jgi:hypothetical protein